MKQLRVLCLARSWVHFSALLFPRCVRVSFLRYFNANFALGLIKIKHLSTFDFLNAFGNTKKKLFKGSNCA